MIAAFATPARHPRSSALIRRVEDRGSSARIAEGKLYSVCDALCAGSPNALAEAHTFEDDER